MRKTKGEDCIELAPPDRHSRFLDTLHGSSAFLRHEKPVTHGPGTCGDCRGSLVGSVGKDNIH